MSSLITGNLFFDSNILNVAAVLLEIAAVTGVYASPAIIWRYAIAQKPIDKELAKKFTVIYAVAFNIIALLVILKFDLSILPILFCIIWTYFSYCILISTGNKDGNFIVKLFDEFQEIAVYIIVGVITTVVSWGVFYILSIFLNSDNPLLLTVNTVLNWSAGVAVAYPMNRHWVFHSKNENRFKEFIGFVTSRLTTLGIEEVVMVLCVNVLNLNQYVSKYVIASILVMILNYVFSKIFVFKKEKK